MARLRLWTDLSEFGDLATLNAAGWQAINNVSIVTSPFQDIEGNGGSRAMRMTGGGGLSWFRTPILAVPVATFYARFHYRQSTIPSAYPFGWYKGLNQLGSIRLDGLSHIQLYAGATLLATSTNSILSNTWYTIEVGITIGNPGTYEVRVNGSSVGWIPPAAGVTQPGADTTADIAFFPIAQNPNEPAVLDYDDFVVDSAAFVGESLMSELAPTGAGNTTQLTPSAGANWQCVDEIPPSDVDYNKATAVNLKDTYAHAPLPGTAVHVRSALLVARIVRAAGADIQTGYLVVRSAGTDYEDAGHHLNPVYTIETSMAETDPATGLAWTVANLNASQIGVRFDA